MSGGVLFYGDLQQMPSRHLPEHGEWRPLFRACGQHRPEAIVLLGDLDLQRPLREQLRPVLAAGIHVRWIPGNHDAVSPEMHDRLWVDHPEGNLHGVWARLGTMTIAGLGGVFKERVWYPRHDAAEPRHASRREFLRRLPGGDRWRGGLPLRVRNAIFPEDLDALRRVRADILVTHEAPTYHRHGFVGIDIAASLCGAKLIIHGHHHESATGRLPSGVRVRGLGQAEVLVLRPEDLAS